MASWGKSIRMPAGYDVYIPRPLPLEAMGKFVWLKIVSHNQYYVIFIPPVNSY